MATAPATARRSFRIAATATLLVTLDATLLFAGFAALRAAFADVSPATLSWMLNACTIVFAALLVPAGSPTSPGASAWSGPASSS